MFTKTLIQAVVVSIISINVEDCIQIDYAVISFNRSVIHFVIWSILWIFIGYLIDMILMRKK
ncbi:hypothetical protein SRRS_15100 [Sporomusa rhizae]